MNESSEANNIKLFDELLIGVREINKQCDTLTALVTQLIANREVMVAAAVRYDRNVHEIYQSYASIYEMLRPLFDYIQNKPEMCKLHPKINQVKFLFEQVRIQQYNTQLILPRLEIQPLT